MQHILVSALPPSAALGGLLPGVGPLFGFRVIVVFFVGVVILESSFTRLTNKSVWPDSPGATFARRLAVAWIVWAVGASFILGNFEAAAGELVSVVTGLLLVVAITRSREVLPSLLRALVVGWIIASAITGTVAVWEIWTGNRLPNFLSEFDRESSQLDSRLIGSTFYNPNEYGVFLVACMPMLWLGYRILSNRLSRLISLSLALLTFPLAAATGGRLILGALILQVLLIGALAGFKILRPALTVLAASIVAILALPATFMAALGNLIPAKLSMPGVGALVGDFSDEGASGGIRLNLAANALWVTWKSAGMGVGPGGFEVAMASGEAPMPTNFVRSPHNWAGELMSQYGIPITVAFFALLLIWIRSGRLFRVNSNIEVQSSARAILVLLAGYLLAGFSHSSFWDSSVNWMIVASLVLLERTATSGASHAARLSHSTHLPAEPSAVSSKHE